MPTDSSVTGDDQVDAVSPDKAISSSATTASHRSDRLRLASTLLISQGLRIGTTMIMARLLTPDDYGLYLLVIAAPGFVTSFGDLNSSGSVIQIRDRDEDEIIHTGTAIVLTMATIHSIAFITAGAILSWSRDDQRMLLGGCLAAVNVFLTLIFGYQTAILNRRGAFRAESSLNILFSISNVVSGIAFAFIGMGMLTLFLQILVSQLIANIAIWRHISLVWPRKATFNCLKRFLNIGGVTALSTYIFGLENTVTSLRLSQRGGDAALGAWNRALTIHFLVSNNFNSAMDRSIVSTLCAKADQHDIFRSISLRAISLLQLFACFASALVLVAGSDIVLGMLGAHWASAVSVVKVLAIAIPFMAFSTTSHIMVLAQGRTWTMLLCALIRTPFLITAVLFVTDEPLYWIPRIWVATQIFYSVLIFSFACRFQPPPLSFFKGWALFIVAALTSGFAAHFIRESYLLDFHVLIRLSLVVTVEFLIYAGIVLTFGRSRVMELVNSVRGSRRPG